MRLSIFKACLGLAFLGATTVSSLAAEKAYLCAINEVFECTAVKGCERISLEDANLAGLMVLDVEKKQLTSLPVEGEPSSNDIEGVTVTDKSILLRGLRGDDGTWSGVVSLDSGRVVASVSTPDSSLSLAGRCTPKR
jgi:hypothetical protein